MPPVPVEPLVADVSADVVVVGAGITGALVAEALSRDRQVAIVDRRGAAEGSTAASTALVCCEIDTPLVVLAGLIGKVRAERAWRRAHRAVRALAARTLELNIACDFARRDSLTLTGTVLDAAALAHETEARQAAGVTAQFIPARAVKDRYGIARAALRVEDDFVVDPRQFAAGFLRAALGRGGRLYAPADASAVDSDRNRVRVQTTGGPTITARQVVYCTGYELPRFLTPRGHRTLSTYALATRPQAHRVAAMDAIIAEASDPYLYLREGPGGRIVCGGEDAEVSDAAARDALLPGKIEAIRDKLARLLPGVDTEPEFAWAGTFGESRTGLPLIGPAPGMPNCYAVVGFGGNGMVYAEIAAEIIAAALAGRSDPDADLYARLD